MNINMFDHNKSVNYKQLLYLLERNKQMQKIYIEHFKNSQQHIINRPLIENKNINETNITKINDDKSILRLMETSRKYIG